MVELQLLAAGAGAVSRASNSPTASPPDLGFAGCTAFMCAGLLVALLHSRNPRASNPKNQADEEDEERRRRRLVGGFENCKVGVRRL